MLSIAAAVDNPKEREAQLILESAVWPGEALLGFSVGRLNPGEFIDKTYYIGLTPRRFLLVRKDQPGRVYSIYRSYVEKAWYEDARLLRSPGLRLQLGGKTVTLETDAAWAQHAIGIVEEHTRWELESPYLTAAQFLDGITDLADLGQPCAAQALLRQHIADDPVVEIEPRSAELDRAIGEGRRALVLSGIMLGFTLLYIIVRTIGWNTLAGPGLLPMMLLFLSVTELVQRHQSWRGHALGMALLAALINLAYGALNSSLMDGIMWSAFGAASALALTGSANRLRNLMVACIFCIGFIGPLVINGVALASAPQMEFADDFSGEKGWVEGNTGAISARVKNDAYQIQVKAPGFTFFAFPPVHINPGEVEFDAQAPEALPGVVGTYGVACSFRNSGAQYMVEIDPAGEQFAFLKQDGEQMRSLQKTYWQPVTGTLVGSGVAHVKVHCAWGKMTLTINSVKQGWSSAPGLSAGGKMGLFVRTWPETGEGGFTTLFDNVYFH